MPGYLPRVSAQIGRGFDLRWSTIDGGGATPISGGVFSLNGTAGQPDAGAASGGTFALASGFWYEPDVALPILTVNDVSLAEGNTGTTNFVFTVTLSPAVNQTITVSAQTAPDTATSPSDFTTVAATLLTFDPQVTTQTFTVPVAGDALTEATEQFFANLSSPTNATLADAQGTGTIQNDDGTSSLTINNVAVTEGNVGTTDAIFTVTLSPASGQTVTVLAQTAPGNATDGVDYTGLPLTTLTFAPGATSQTVTVAVIGDTLPESVENFAVNLSTATNATITDAQGVGTITDDDGTPSLSINDVRVSEGNFGMVNAVFAVTLSPASTLPVAVVARTATVSGTAIAVAGTDYAAAGPISLTFAPGVTSQLVSVSVIGDTIPEPNETFAVTLSGATNATIADAEGVGTIADDDAHAEFQNDPGDDDTEDKPKETEEERQQRGRTDRSSQDDIRTEGNVVEIRRNEDPPVVVIANKDGLVELHLVGDARRELRNLEVGQYVVASGEKEHEQFYFIDDLSIE